MDALFRENLLATVFSNMSEYSTGKSEKEMFFLLTYISVNNQQAFCSEPW